MSGSPENYKGQYGSLKFPTYKYQEYPKMLYKDDAKKHQLGMVNNAMEEKELYASIGVDKADIDPVGAMADELVQLKARLAKYEGNDLANQIAPQGGQKTTSTVEMLPEEPKGIQSTDAGAKPQVAGNPLLKPHVPPAAGNPQPVGSAPKVDKIINPGV